jgi:hypothetical protein
MSTEPNDIRPYNPLRGMQVGAKQRRAFVAKHAIAGYSAPQIAMLWNKYVTERGEEERRVSTEAIKADRRKILAEINKQHTEELQNYRGLLIERYEFVIKSLHPMVQKANLGAIDRYLKTLQQIGDVTGSHAPIKLEVDNVTTLTPEERQRRVMEILAKARGRSADDDDVIDVEAEEVYEEDLPLLPGETSRDND